MRVSPELRGADQPGQKAKIRRVLTSWLALRVAKSWLSPDVLVYERDRLGSPSCRSMADRRHPPRPPGALAPVWQQPIVEQQALVPAQQLSDRDHLTPAI
jgi:hypothetical protein